MFQYVSVFDLFQAYRDFAFVIRSFMSCKVKFRQTKKNLQSLHCHGFNLAELIMTRR